MPGPNAQHDQSYSQQQGDLFQRLQKKQNTKLAVIGLKARMARQGSQAHLPAPTQLKTTKGHAREHSPTAAVSRI